jgi:hypothetical protein
MDHERPTKQRELEYQHADPYIVSLLLTARQYLELHKKVANERPTQVVNEPRRMLDSRVAVG